MLVKKTYISFTVDHFTADWAQIFSFLYYFISHQCFYVVNWIFLNFCCLFDFLWLSKVVKELLLLELFNFNQVRTFDSKQPDPCFERFHKINDSIKERFLLVRIFYKVKSLISFLKWIGLICEDNIHWQKSHFLKLNWNLFTEISKPFFKIFFITCYFKGFWFSNWFSFFKLMLNWSDSQCWFYKELNCRFWKTYCEDINIIKDIFASLYL